ncbi:MAG TPA: acyltransferase family protein [Ramlibacter sp.]|nr:acyltransferase family protein [Ramlibacter sp.]
MTTPAGEQRLHALDNLRGLMMWLGIVLHVAVIHMVGVSPLPWRDNMRAAWADGLAAFIHAFRMPVFFILAGFFVALLVQRRGPRAMLVNRMKRLALPFALFWLPVFSACVVFALMFVHRMARGTWGIDVTLMPTGPTVPKGPSTVHMWFLWMLVWFSAATVLAHGLARRLPAAWPDAVARLLAHLASAWWGFALLALPLAWVGSFYWNGVVAPGGAFIPPPAEWLHNGLFFVFGYALHAHQQPLFALFMRRWPLYAGAGAVFFVATGALVELLARPQAAPPHLPFWIALAYNCASWLWAFALIGGFLRYLPRQHAVLTYLARSSYWVYLVHMPLTIGVGAWLWGLDWPVSVKLAVNVTATTLVCLASYEMFVRNTGVSVLLNGRRHPRNAASPPRITASGRSAGR